MLPYNASSTNIGEYCYSNNVENCLTKRDTNEINKNIPVDGKSVALPKPRESKRDRDNGYMNDAKYTDSIAYATECDKFL